jgi:cytochrome c-type biogenesis protein CcmH/NrfG
VLHRFVEGTLTRTSARDVAIHIDICRDCRFIVRETMELLRDDGELLTEDSSEPSGSGRGWWLALAAAVIIGFVVVWFLVPAGAGRRFDRALETTPVRTVEGRLAKVPYVEYQSHRGKGERAVPARLEALARDVLEETPENDAREWHRRGIASLVAGDPSAAVNALKRAAQLDARNALYWSDLSAARIAQGMKARDPGVLANATRDAQRALKLAPDLPEAHFNVALSFERRQLFNEARFAYERYLTFDPSSGWASEARSRRDKLRQ